MRKEATKEMTETIHVMDRFDPAAYKDPAGPVVSIYLPIHHAERERRRDEKDRLEFKNLMKEAERALAEQHDNPRDYAGIMERMEYLLDHEDLTVWLDAGAALGFLISNDRVHAFNIGIDIDPTVVAGDRYYVKPILRNSQYGNVYKLLLLNTDFFALLEGDHSAVHYIPLPDDVKHYFAETYPEFDGETTALDYYSLEDHESPYRDHKSRNEVTQEEAEKFFRYVDKALKDKLVRDDPTPVILVCAPEHASMYRKINSLKQLMPVGIEKDARALTGTELRDAAVKIMQAESDARLVELKEKLAYELSKGGASQDMSEIGFALAEKKVAVLFLEAGKGIPGTFDAATGKVQKDERAASGGKQLDPASPDIANAFAQAAIAQDAMLFVLTPDKMPVEGMAAIYRY